MNEMNEINIDDIIKSYFDRDNVLIAHQINSYNYYIIIQLFCLQTILLYWKQKKLDYYLLIFQRSVLNNL